MPTVSMFYGVIIRMYFAPGEHNPPHIHAYYNDYKIILNIRKMEFMDGEMPRKQKRLILAWAELHKDELLANWELAMNGESIYQIPPLS